MNPKPPWLLYAAEVREELKKIRPSKSGKRYDEHLYRTWLKAHNELGYEGSSKDWDYLVHHFDKVNKGKRFS